MSGKKFIYNVEQANFYMQQGVVCKGTELHHTTGKVFFIFNWDDTQEAFKLWMDRK